MPPNKPAGCESGLSNETLSQTVSAIDVPPGAYSEISNIDSDESDECIYISEQKPPLLRSPTLMIDLTDSDNESESNQSTSLARKELCTSTVADDIGAASPATITVTPSIVESLAAESRNDECRSAPETRKRTILPRKCKKKKLMTATMPLICHKDP